MKERVDLVRGWLRKASSDVVALEASLKAGSLDAACFHAQQAAEKYLKAYLTHAGVEFPYTHNLLKLVELSAQRDASFESLAPLADSLNPYAVELRYDVEFWPGREAAALTVRDRVLALLPPALVEN